MKTNQEYKNAALSRIQGNWSPLVIASIIYVLVIAAICGASSLPALFNPASIATELGSTGATFLLAIFLASPLELGFANAMRVFFESNDLDCTNNMVRFSTTNYLHKVLGMFFMGLKVCLWTMLFFIPGIVMSFAYAMTPYILEENPELSAWEASTRSREMMKGHKFDLFYLYLSFIGWFILCLLTAGIGFIWLCPYFKSTEVAFYEDLKGATVSVAE